MGHVAVSAGYYLMAKLGMKQVAEFSAEELFDLEYIEVKQGLIVPGQRPRSRIFKWDNPNGKHDLIVFIGEAQPPLGKYAFCRRLIEFSREHHVERVFTFAAMATQMHPESPSRVFGAATDGELLRELQRLEIEVLEDGHISGLNGILLGVAAETEMRGTCLLGEIPHIFSQLPFPKAALAVLEVFSTISNIQIDLSELRQHSQSVERQLGQALAQVEEALGHRLGQGEGEPEVSYSPEPPEEERLSSEDMGRIEDLFVQAEKDKSKAYELKCELDRLKVFKDYEDRFLDLFRKQD
jgi:proteasome assembly chaperone (PAC2) family protein